MGYDTVFMGAEVPSHRTLLMGANVKHVSVNYWRLKKRGLPTTKKYLLSEKLPDDVKIYLTPGSKQAVEEFTDNVDLWGYVEEYLDFAVLNKDRITALTEFDSQALGSTWLQQHRERLVNDFTEDNVWAVWHHDSGTPLDALAQQFPNVAIPGESIEADTTLSGRLRALGGMYGTQWHAIGHSRPDDLRSLPVETVSTLAWLAPMLRGETVVWDGVRLVRYPKRMKDQARQRLAPVCERAGLDFEKITNDDPNENARLAIWSYQQLEQRMSNSKVSDQSDEEGGDTTAETGVVVPAQSTSSVRNSNKVIARDPKERMNLPVFGFDVKQDVEKDADGNDVVVQRPIVKSTHGTMRQCNTCFVAANCPAAKKDSECAFNLPVEVKTKEQLRSLLNAIIEMQGSRVAFARFSEELNGGYPDPNTSQEIDRLFKLVKTLKELEDNREFIRMTVERQGAGGVLSQIFGDKANALKELPGGGIDADTTNRIIADGLEG